MESIFALLMIIVFSIMNLGFLSATLGALAVVVAFSFAALIDNSNWEESRYEKLRSRENYACVLTAVAYVLVDMLLDSEPRYIEAALTELAWNQITLWVMLEFLRVCLLGIRTRSLRGVWPMVPKEKKCYTMCFGSLHVSADSETVRLYCQDSEQGEMLELYGRHEYEDTEYVWLLPTFYDEEMANGLIILRRLSEENEEYETADDPDIYKALCDQFKNRYGTSFDFMERDELVRQARARYKTKDVAKDEDEPETTSEYETASEEKTANEVEPEGEARTD